MIKILEGKTGCGKTYTAINRSIKNGTVAYLAPTRLLVYDSFIQYGSPEDNLVTSACKIFGDKQGNFYGTPMSLKASDVKSFSTLIIDEAHWMTLGDDQGRHMANLIQEAALHKVDVYLLTATRNFKALEGWEIEELPPLASSPEIKQIKMDEFLGRVAEGVPSLVISSSIDDSMEAMDQLKNTFGESSNLCFEIIDRRFFEDEILEAVLAFNRGEIDVLLASNIAAQGINTTAENLLIITNEYDDSTSIKQKLGRLGRFGRSSAEIVTFCEPNGENLLDYINIEAEKIDISQLFEGDNLIEENEDYCPPDDCSDEIKEIILKEKGWSQRPKETFYYSGEMFFSPVTEGVL